MDFFKGKYLSTYTFKSLLIFNPIKELSASDISYRLF